MKVLQWFPGARMLTSYRVSWLRRDVVAGIVLTTLLVPQGMAYAELAGLPPITGLYTTVLCLIGYAVFGPSRVLVLGPDSALGSMIAATILPIIGSNGSPEQAIALASILALMVGAIMIVAGVARLGFVADLLSKPTQIGYMNGLALTILISQLPKLFGLSIDANGLINEASAFVHGLVSGEAVGDVVAIGLVSLGLILVLGRWLPRIPGVLVAVLVAIAASKVFDLGAHGVSLIGPLPQGFPPLTIPSIKSISDLPVLVVAAIALVSLTDTISTASAFAARTGQEFNGNGEMIGIGVANVAASNSPRERTVSTSASRTAVARASRRQDTGHRGRRSRSDRVDARVRALAAAKSSPTDTRRPGHRGITLAGQHPRNRASLASASHRVPALDHGISWCGTVRRPPGHRDRCSALDPQHLPTSMVAIPYHTRPRPGLPGHHDQQQHPDAEELPGLVIFRFDAPLFFANARTFRDHIRFAEASPRPRWIVIAAEPMTDVDTTAADMLVDLDEELNARGIFLVFAELARTMSERSSSAMNSSAPSIQITSSPPSTPQSTPFVKRRALTGYPPSRPTQRPGNSRPLRLLIQTTPATTLPPFQDMVIEERV